MPNRSSLTKKLALAFALAVVTGCSSSDDSEKVAVDPLAALPTLEGSPLPSFGPPGSGSETGTVRFSRIEPGTSGVDFTASPATGDPLDTGTPFQTGGGVAAGDIDGDGLPDLLFTDRLSGVRIFLLKDPATLEYEDATSAIVGGQATTGATGATMVDIDADGHLDIYLCRENAADLLLLNDGGSPPKLKDGAEAAGLDIAGTSLMACFCDHDGDGDLDLFLVDSEEPGRLFRNNPDKATKLPNFAVVTIDAGLRTLPKHGRAAAWFDANRDDWPDLYVAAGNGERDRVYLNLPRKGSKNPVAARQFQDVTFAILPASPRESSGIALSDFNNDGIDDIFVCNRLGSLGPPPGPHFQFPGSGEGDGLLDRSALFINAGLVLPDQPRFFECAALAGIPFVSPDPERPWTTRAAAAADIDGDGRSDLVTGELDLWMNRGEWRFERESTISEPVANILATDLDGDGNIDLVATRFGKPAVILRNSAATSRRAVVRVTGPGANANALGARVEAVFADGSVQSRRVMPTNGLLTCGTRSVAFGLGDAESIRMLRVSLAGYGEKKLRDLKAGRGYVIALDEPATMEKKSKAPAPMFVRAERTLHGAGQQETPGTDYDTQPMLPCKFSAPGPGIAWGDMDGDGYEDFIRGHADEEHKQFIYSNHGPDKRNNNRIRFRREPLWIDMPATGREVTSILIFDVNGDARPDIYLMNGSNEAPRKSHQYDDILLMGAGKNGHYQHIRKYEAWFWEQKATAKAREKGEAEPVLPDFPAFPDAGDNPIPVSASTPHLHDSGSVAAAADFDRDGDLDLFAGSRLVPARYPESPKSRIFRNDTDHTEREVLIKDVTEDLAPGLHTCGMVTSGIWSDVDNDGWIDLVITRDWGPPGVFRNVNGKLTEVVPDGFGELSGFWNGISAADIDNDGDIDYAITNLGLNTEYAALPAVAISLIDVEGAEKPILYERGAEKGEPFLSRRRAFNEAASKLGGSDKVIEAAKNANTLVAREFRSGVLINESNGSGEIRFSFKPFAAMAQLAPAFGVVLADFDADGLVDCCIAQNQSNRRPEAGPARGGLSLFMRGKGNGEFEALWPAKSGIHVNGDARALTVVDLDRDSRPDLVFSVNGADPVVFMNRAGKPAQTLAVKLSAGAWNPTAVGARATLHLKSGARRTAEVYAGGGYLSQSTPTLFFGIGAKDTPAKIEIRWPDGTRSSRKLGAVDRGKLVSIEKGK